jgi:hypothetical protein
MKVGDTITQNTGVNDTDIPVGATVRYANGVCQSSTTTTVRIQNGRKVLGLPGGDLFYHGHGGPMTILSLPEAKEH